MIFVGLVLMGVALTLAATPPKTRGAWGWLTCGLVSIVVGLVS